MRYLIAYQLRGDDKDAVDRLRTEIAERFDVHAALRIPPHMTFFRPFEADDVAALRAALRRIADGRVAEPLRVTGFGSFDKTVWFVDVEQRPELFALKDAIARAVTDTTGVADVRADRGTHLHVTLAYRDVTPEVFAAIGTFLRDRRPPLDALAFDNITLFAYPEGRWEPDETFVFGALR